MHGPRQPKSAKDYIGLPVLTYRCEMCSVHVLIVSFILKDWEA